MAQTFTGGTNPHLLSSTAPFTSFPYSWGMAVQSAGGQARYFASVANSGDLNNMVGLQTDRSASATNKVSTYISNSSANGQTLSGSAIPVTGAWCFIGATETGSAHAAWLNGVKGTPTGGNFSFPTGINRFVLSGRPTDFIGGAAGQIAHMWAINRALSDTEMMYLTTGGNPRAIKGMVCYYKIASGENPVLDQIGTNNLTPSGSPTASTSEPDFTTFQVGSNIPVQNWTSGTAITLIDLSATGGIIDQVASAYNAALSMLATPTTPTTVPLATSAAREFVVSSATGITAGMYCKLNAGGSWARILQVNGTSILVDRDLTATSSATFYLAAVNALTISGMNMAANKYSGTPSSSAVTYSNTLFRLTCAADNSKIWDTNLQTINIAASGGGGGGSTVYYNPCGSSGGGFLGG